MTQPMIDRNGNPWFEEYKLGQLPSRSPDTELIRCCHNTTIIETHDAARYYLAFGETVAKPPDRVLLLCVAHDTVVFGNDEDWSVPERWAQTPETWCEGCRTKVLVAPKVPEQVFLAGPAPQPATAEPEPAVAEEPVVIETPAAPVPVAVAEELPQPLPDPEPLPPSLPDPVLEPEPPLPDPEPPVEPYEPPPEPVAELPPDPVPFVEPLPVVDPPPPEPEPYYLPPMPEPEVTTPGAPVIDMAAIEAGAAEAPDAGSFASVAPVPNPPPPEPKAAKVERKPMPLDAAAPVVAAYTALRARIEALEAEIEQLKLEGSELLAPLSGFSPSFELKGQWYMIVNKGGKYHLSFCKQKPGRPTKGSEA